MYSDECGGPVRVSVKPLGYSAECGADKSAVQVRVTPLKGNKTGLVWSPSSPLCLGSMAPVIGGQNWIKRATEDALAFYDHHRCGRGRPDDE